MHGPTAPGGAPRRSRRPGGPVIARIARPAARRLKRTLEHAFNVSISRRRSYDATLFDTLAWIRRWADGDVVLDVGANDGRTVQKLLRHLPARPLIHAFEPVAATHAVLVRNTAGLPVVCHRTALGAAAGEATMFVDGVSATNTMREGVRAGGTEETVTVGTVDGVAGAAGIDRIALLKVDAEGHDLEVLKGGERLLGEGRVDLVQVEVGFRGDDPAMQPLEAVRAHLEPRGYALYGLFNQSHGPRSVMPGAAPVPMLVYADALFVSARAESLRIR